MTQRIREAYKMLHRGAHAVVYYAQPLCSAVGTSCLIFCHAHYLCVLRVLCVSNSTAQLEKLSKLRIGVVPCIFFYNFLSNNEKISW